MNQTTPFKAKSHRYELNPEDQQLAGNLNTDINPIGITQQINEAQANINLYKAQIDRMKKRISMLEKSSNLVGMDNQIKAVEFEIE